MRYKVLLRKAGCLLNRPPLKSLGTHKSPTQPTVAGPFACPLNVLHDAVDVSAARIPLPHRASAPECAGQIRGVGFCLGQRAAIQRGHESKSMTPTLVLASTFTREAIDSVLGTGTDRLADSVRTSADL